MRPQPLLISQHQRGQNAPAINQRAAVKHMTAVGAEEVRRLIQKQAQTLRELAAQVRILPDGDFVTIQEVTGEHPEVVIIEDGLSELLVVPAVSGRGLHVENLQN